MSKIAVIGALSIAAIVVGMIVTGPQNEGGVPYESPSEQKSMARQSIEICWEDQQRKSLDPATQRFVAGVCESMESKFVAKYGHKP